MHWWCSSQRREEEMSAWGSWWGILELLVPTVGNASGPGKNTRLNPQVCANALFLCPSSGLSSTNTLRTSFLIIYALQLLSISNHTFILAQNNLPRSCLQEDFSWSTFTFKPLFLWTLLWSSTENTFLQKLSCGTEPSEHPVPTHKITALCLGTWFSTDWLPNSRVWNDSVPVEIQQWLFNHLYILQSFIKGVF